MIIPANKKKTVTVILAKKMAGGGEAMHESTPEQGMDEHSQDKISIGNDLLSAIQSGSANGVAQALEAMFELLESMPHEESDNEE
jgi:hypothetical protein